MMLVRYLSACLSRLGCYFLMLSMCKYSVYKPRILFCFELLEDIVYSRVRRQRIKSRGFDKAATQDE